MGGEDASRYEAVELQFVDRGLDLWAAVEAAQYARTVTFDDPESDVETAAITRFVEAFSHSAESWEEVPMTAKAAALDSLGRHLGELERVGFYVYCGTVERDFAMQGRETRALPIAIVSVGRTRAPAVTVMLPTSLDVTA